MGQKFSNLFYVGHNYREEVRTQIRMLIIITLAFTIAFSWRETIFEFSRTLVQRIMGTENGNSLNALTSLFITFISVLLIFLVSHYLKKKD